MTTFKDVLFCSMFDGDSGGSVAKLLKLVGAKELNHCDWTQLIVFNGGADIGTSIYNEQPVYTSAPRVPSRRDEIEIDAFTNYPDAFKLGICRGSQLLNCLNGGTLWQDVDRHCRDHMIIDTRTHEKILATSTHHQMMRPGPKGIVIATADEATRKDAEHDHWSAKGGVFFADDHKDTEIVWYPDTRSLCIQGHPEYVPGSRFADYCLELVINLMNEALCAA